MKSNPYFTLVAAISASTLLLASCGGDSDNQQSSSPTSTQDSSCLAVNSSGSSVVIGSNLPGDPSLPEAASGYRTGLKPVYAKTYSISNSIV
jgi:gamma-glutamyltranspeptidase / glutathione hydrolase